MKRIAISLSAGLLILILTSEPIWAQAVSTISGTVRDQSGAVLPGAEIIVTQTDTALVRNALTDESGSYTLTNLPSGPYRLDVSLPGFRTYVQTGIVLQVNSSPVINAVLEVGQVSEQVEVQADATMVETRSSGVGQMIDNQRILELPLNGRQATDLILLAGMATPSVGNALTGGSRSYPTQIISIAGGMSNGTTYLLDGGTHNDPYNNLNMPFPFPDALQEFKVETSALPAQYGQHSAGAVNAVTKSGTNSYHGDLFEFLRNGAMNARNAFATTRDNLKRHQFGGTIGGPIVRNKFFFFAGYQGTTTRSNPSATRAFIPNAEMLSGNFTRFTSPACNGGRQVALRPPFVDNQISPSQFSTAALNVVRRLPTTTDPCGEIIFSRKSATDENLAVARADYQLSEKHSLFGRYIHARLDTATDYDGENILTLSTGNIYQRAHSFVLGDTYLIGNGVISNFRATVNRSKNPKVGMSYFDFNDVGINAYVPIKGLLTSSFGPFSIAGIGALPGIYNWTNYQLSEDLSLVRGAHQVGIGFNYIHSEMNFHGYSGVPGGFTFNGNATGTTMTDFLLGLTSQYQQASVQTGYPRQNVVGMYLQDNWKASPRLNVSAGIRWEPFLSVYDAEGRKVYFDKAKFDRGVRSTVFVNAPPGLMFPGDPDQPGNSAHNNRWAQFAPRLGLVFDPKGDGRMTIRSAYGLLYDMPQMFYYYAFATNQPFGNRITLTQPTGGLANPWQGYPGGNPFPLNITGNLNFQPAGTYATHPQDVHAPYVHQWNLSIQKQLGTDWMTSANYVGTTTIHLWTGTDVNPVVFLPDATCVINGQSFTPCSTTANSTARRLLTMQNATQGPFYSGGISALDDGGTANYNALQLSIQRRRSNGLTLQGNYTWSHCISDLVNQQLGMSGENYLIPDNREFDRGNCTGQDRRHVFNMSSVYATPQFSNRAAQLLASDWQISGIVRLMSGGNFDVSSGVDSSLTAKTSRADQVLDSPYHPDKNIDHWLNPAAFASPARGTWGNMGRNAVRGPGAITIDLGLTRTFRVREAQTIQFRMEAFNLPNHVNPNNPAASLTAPNFGRITSAADPRILQVALKYVF